jgi:hypothetical protein
LASHSHDTSKKVMYRAICEQRRAIQTAEGVESPEGSFAEWHGCARIHAQLQNTGT